MDARRVRVLVVTLFSVSLLTPLWIASAVAATCALTAPATVAIGTPLAIVGSGFPASSSVAVSVTLAGGSPDEFQVQSDASGAFTISLTPEAADAGRTTVVATAGAVCTARVVFTVGTSNAPVSTEPSSSKAAAGTAAPRTDTVDVVPARATGMPFTDWLVAVLLLVIGLGGLVATRPVRGR
jgi:hypothetical protein